MQKGLTILVLGRWVLRAAARFYFAHIERFHRGRVPSKGPIAFTFHPPNPLVDVAVIDRGSVSIRLPGAILLWLVAGLLLVSANLPAAEAQTNTSPARTTVAVLRWLPVEPPPMAPEDHHWLRTFSGLVASELRQVAALRVLPEEAVFRESARQKRDEPDNTNGVLGIRRLGENLRAQGGVVWGFLTRTGATWTAYASAVDATSGEFGERLSAASTNWFELRDQVVRHVLRRLDIAPSPEEQKLLGRVWTTSPKALDWVSRAMAVSEGDFVQETELCRKALAEDPQFVEARGLLVGALYNLGHDEEALRAAREALSQKPDRHLAAQLRLASACVLLRQGQENQAQQEVAEGLRLSPDNADLLTLQSSFHEGRGDLEAASDCLRKALECDPRNPRLYALLGLLESKQGDLTNALASLELAEQLVVDTLVYERVDIELALAKAYASIGNLAEALRHYRSLLAEAHDENIPESRIKSVQETVHELERRSQPVPVVAEKPRQYSPAELEAALREQLNPEEFALAVNPIASTPEMARWAGEIVAGTQGDLARARKLYEQLASRPRAAGGASRTAQEVFAAWKDLGQLFQCQEYAKLFVALARSVDLAAFYVHVDRDYCNRIVDHDCAVVFAEGKAWLADPAYVWFGVPHLEFRVLDDLQTVAHHAFQPHDENLRAALCRAGCKLDPEFTWGRMSLVAALIRSDQLDEARQELAAARKSAPEYWRGHQLEGVLALKQGQNDRALQWLRKAAEANPDAGDTRLLLGLALFRSGQQAAAREELLAGLRRSHWPGNEEIAGETLALIEEALGLGSNVRAASKSPLGAVSYRHLGNSFLFGSNPDYAAATKWFRKAAELGDAQAQLALGLAYWTGRGVPKDPATAVGWFRKAADGGDPQAMRNLGLAYARGVGVMQSPKEALRWWRRAAEGGDAESQAVLGGAYYEGKVVPKNLAEALFWLMLAVKADATPYDVSFGESHAGSVLRQARHLLKEVELFASPDEMAEAKARAERFKAKRASESGAQESPLMPSRATRKGDVTEPK